MIIWIYLVPYKTAPGRPILHYSSHATSKVGEREKLEF